MMKRKILLALWVVVLSLSLVAVPNPARSQQAPMQEDDGAFFLGSFVISLLHFPFKLATCLGTQATAAVAYTATYGVAGNYDGNTNGRDIGEVARRSCTGDWFISPQQIKKDYGE